MKKRISLKDWTYIAEYNPVRKLLQPFSSYYLISIENGFRREVKVNLIAYLLLIVPASLLQILYLIWDGGLCEFTFERRYVGYNDFYKHSHSEIYSRAKEVWKRKK